MTDEELRNEFDRSVVTDYATSHDLAEYFRTRTSVPWKTGIRSSRNGEEVRYDLEAADRMPSAISGGMKKRAALARVLVAQPKAILYDEPTAGLDPVMARTVGHLIRDVQSSGDRTALVVTHDLELAFAVATRVGLHYEGQLIELAEPDEPQVRGAANDRKVVEAKRLTVLGEHDADGERRQEPTHVAIVLAD